MEQSGNKNTKMGQKWEQNENRQGQDYQIGTRMENKMALKWEQEYQKGTSMGTKWIKRGQEHQSGTRMGTKMEEQSGIKMKFRIPKWRKNGNKRETN